MKRSVFCGILNIQQKAIKRWKIHNAEKGRSDMNEKEVAEIRRRFRPEKSNITCVRGCYVKENR